MHNVATEEPQFEKLAPGTLLSSRYEVIGELGEGGFAVVYRGTDIEIGRQIAIKVLNLASFSHDPDAKANVVERFRREGKTASRIHHPNAVAIYDFGETPAGWPFIIMELLNGYDLDVEVAKHGTLTPERAVRLFAPCLEALGKAHDLGVVHKDLKPGNLFLCDPRTEEERLVILDFGVARINSGDDASRLTTDGQILGTPQYMAPEYIESQTAVPALDVYQMGLILVESLTGVPVVNEENMVTCLIMHTTGQIPIPKEVLDSPLGGVIKKSTALKHQDRYQDGHAFQAALLALSISGGKAIARPHTPVTPIERDPEFAKTEVVQWNPANADQRHNPTPPPADDEGFFEKLGISTGMLAIAGIGIGFLILVAIVAGALFFFL